MNNIVLNVSGRIFETKYETLIKVPYFKHMFEGCESVPTEVIFINRSSNIFEHVLGLVIDPLYPYPKKYAFELDFYGVDYSKMKLYDKSPKYCNKRYCNIMIKTNEKMCGLHIDHYNFCNLIGCKEYKCGGGSSYCEVHAPDFSGFF
jgi:hypothetical protein